MDVARIQSFYNVEEKNNAHNKQKTVQPETAPSSEGKVGEITPSRPSWRASSLRGTPRRSR